MITLVGMPLTSILSCICIIGDLIHIPRDILTLMGRFIFVFQMLAGGTSVKIMIIRMDAFDRFCGIVGHVHEYRRDDLSTVRTIRQPPRVIGISAALNSHIDSMPYWGINIGMDALTGMPCHLPTAHRDLSTPTVCIQMLSHLGHMQCRGESGRDGLTLGIPVFWGPYLMAWRRTGVGKGFFHGPKNLFRLRILIQGYVGAVRHFRLSSLGKRKG